MPPCRRQALISGQGVPGVRSPASAFACTQRPASRKTCRSRPTLRFCAPTWAAWCYSSRSWASMTWWVACEETGCIATGCPAGTALHPVRCPACSHRVACHDEAGCPSLGGPCTSLAAQQGTGLGLAGFPCRLFCCPGLLLPAASTLPDSLDTFVCMHTWHCMPSGCLSLAARPSAMIVTTFLDLKSRPRKRGPCRRLNHP